MTDTEIPVTPEGVDAKDYWTFRVRGVSFMYAMKKLTKLLGEDYVSEKTMLVFPFNSALTFMFAKKRISPEQITRVLGLSAEALEKKSYFTLIEKTNPDLPQPTVDYWGEA